MNTAIQDGHDLGWKLAWVLRGWAERAARQATNASGDRLPSQRRALRRPERIVPDTEEELRVDLGGRIPHHWLTHREAASPHSTSSARGSRAHGARGARAGAVPPTVSPQGPPLAVDALDAVTARALGIVGEGALIVQPDGVPVDRLARAESLAGAIADVSVARGLVRGGQPPGRPRPGALS